MTLPLQLNLLGRFEARLASGELVSLPTRKTETLLAYLALVPGPHSRDHLANLLWSDRNEQQARNSLRQALNALKKLFDDFEPQPLQIEHQAVNLASHFVEIDAVKLEELVQDQTPKTAAQAVKVYRGEFLEGLVVRDSNGEEWLAAERERFRRLAIHALESALDFQLQSGELNTARETGERLVSLDRLNESAWQQLMRVYMARGERSHALMAYKRCSEVLKKELCVAPSQETYELHILIRDGSAEVKTGSADSGPIITNESIPADTAGAPESVNPFEKPSIAILPFLNMSGDPEQDYFADGMSEEIITALSRIPDLVVISRNSTFVYKGRAVDVRQVGRELDVGYVLEGSIRKTDHRVRITAQLVSTQSGDHIWAERYDRNLDDIFAVQDEITHNIVVELQIKLVTGEYSRLMAKGTNNIEAWELVIRSVPLGEAHVRDDAMLAKQLLGRALELDNNYAAAWSLLGWIYWEEAIWEWSSEPEKSLQMAFDAAQKSLSLDERHPDTYSLLGHIFMERCDTNQAISMCERATELAPSDAEALALLANVLVHSGRVKEGSLKIQKALRLCPFPPPWYSVLLGACLHLDGDNEAAISALEQGIEREPESNLGRPWLASTLVEMGRLDEARVITKAALKIDPTFSTMGWSKMSQARSNPRLKGNLIAAGFPE